MLLQVLLPYVHFSCFWQVADGLQLLCETTQVPDVDAGQSELAAQEACVQFWFWLSQVS